MLNDAMDQVILVKGWKKGAYWSFPRGKINKDERDLDCAIREVYEETGFDIRGAGLVGREEDMKFIEVTMREQHMRLYVFRGVPMDTHFEPRTRKEISKIQWYKLSDLPTMKKAKQQQEGRGEDLATNANKFYMVAPFLVPLKKWIAQQKKLDATRGIHADPLPLQDVTEDIATDAEPATENPGNHQAAGDMERLLNHLRQSSQRDIPSNHPEVSAISKPSNDASAQLKRLLRVKDSSPVKQHPLVQDNAPNHDDARSNSLLALLRGEAGNPATDTYNRAPPQTPMEHIITDPVMPRSPHQHHPRPPPVSSLPPPPSFAFPPHTDYRQAQYSAGQQGGPGNSRLPSNSNLGNNAGIHHMGPPLQSSTLRTRVSGPAQPPVGSMAHGPGIASVSQQSQIVPPPYHRNGDPRFATAPQFPNLHAPSIPPASNLPLPQLNRHSLALLNAFKNGEVKKPAPADTFIQAPPPSDFAPNLNHTDQARRDTVMKPHAQEPEEIAPKISAMMQERARTASRIGAPPSALNPAIVDRNESETDQESLGLSQIASAGLETAANQPNTGASFDTVIKHSVPDGKLWTQHQDALLNLFRKPSVPTADVPRPSIAVAPSIPVELSAQPSNKPSVETSLKHPNNPVLPAINTRTRAHLVHPSTDQKQTKQEPPTSATVTGPLDVPRFEGVTKKSKETTLKVNNGTSSGFIPREPQRASPMSILRRPASAQKAVPEVIPGKDRKRIAATPKRPELTSKPSAESVPKPFQPQILRRPVQPPQQPPSTAIPAAPAATLERNMSSPRHDSQAKDTKQTPLPLYNMSGGAAPAESPALLSSRAPIHAEPTQVDNARVTPVRSRIGSVFSSAEDGSPKPSSPMTPIERNFLLGFLQSVARGDRS